MSLFLFQQKIPFESVSNYLRVFEPGSPINPNDWARMHAGGIAVGDLIFVFEPMYSPWSDSSSGIGVAEGDSFYVAAIAVAYKLADGLAAYVIRADAFERHNLQDYLANQVQAAKTNGAGFYYALARSPVGMPPDVVRDLAELDSFGSSGRRQDENQPIDILYAFFTAASWTTMVHPGQQPDIAQIGYCIFCDKEPPPGSNVPDLRAHVQPVGTEDKPHQNPTPEGLGPTSTVAAPGPQAPKPIQIPKIPSFFKPGKQQLGDGRSMPRIISPGGPLSPPTGAEAQAPSMPAGAEDDTQRSALLAAPGNGPSSSVPNQIPAEPQSQPQAQQLGRPAWTDPTAQHVSAEETEQVPAVGVSEIEQYPALEGGTPSSIPPGIPGQMPSGVPGRMPPPLPVQMPPGIPGQALPPSLGQMPLPLPDQTLPLPGHMPPTSPMADLALPLSGQMPPPLPMGAQTPPPLPGIDWAQMLSAEPMATPSTSPLPAPAAEGPRSADPPAAPTPPHSAGVPPPLPSTQDPAPAQTAADSTSPVVARPSGSSSAHEVPSLAELLGNIGRDADSTVSQSQSPSQSPAAAIDTADGDSALVTSGPPAKKKVDVELQNRILKEQVQVKSGVAGLVSKLEQQASKASSRLEGQVDEIQNGLTRELSELLAKVTSAENRGARNAQDLSAELSERMDGATTQIVEKIAVAVRDGAHRVKQHEEEGGAKLGENQDHVRTTLNDAFDEVRERAEAIAKTFVEKLAKLSCDSSVELETLRDRLTDQLSQLYGSYESVLQAAFDSFDQRLESANSSIAATVEGRYSFLQGQLAELQARCSTRLEQMRQSYVSQLDKQFAVAQSDVRKLRATSLEDTVIPRLRRHREELRVVTSEFQSKLAEDLEAKGEEKLAEFEPALAEKKGKLTAVLHATTAVKDALEQQLQERLQSIADQLKLFVETGVEQAQTAFKDTEDHLAEIDRAVRALADPSRIEGDLELLNERNQVLSTMDEATQRAKDEVLNTLRTSVAGLEEKGKQLQEELISSMEEDAYRVRRASEQALHDIREAITQAFAAIQTAQDERMPM